MGQSIALARSAEWREDRASAAPVVKPSWLFTITWIVPPVVNLSFQTCLVVGQGVQVQRLIHDTLACESCITMEDDSEFLVPTVS